MSLTSIRTRRGCSSKCAQMCCREYTSTILKRGRDAGSDGRRVTHFFSVVTFHSPSLSVGYRKCYELDAAWLGAGESHPRALPELLRTFLTAFFCPKRGQG